MTWINGNQIAVDKFTNNVNFHQPRSDFSRKRFYLSKHIES